jgi:hypothetical protein
VTGLDGAALDGGLADTATAARWLDDGVAPSGMRGRAFTSRSVHGFDLVFAAPKSVSLLRALTDDIGEKVMANAHIKAVHAAMTYLHQHAGYTRVHNPVTGEKELQRLPGLVSIVYQRRRQRLRAWLAERRIGRSSRTGGRSALNWHGRQPRLLHGRRHPPERKPST